MPTANEIKNARRDLGYTQAQAAQIIGSSARTWQDWERGVHKMSNNNWYAFCNFTGYEPTRDKGVTSLNCEVL